MGKIVLEERIFVPLLIVLVGAGAFGLGRLSTDDREQRVPVQIIESAAVRESQAAALGSLSEKKSTETPTTTTPVLQDGGKLVGSKNGTKYHFPWCSGAVRILEENKLWFNSIEEARAAGYTPAANCKGLE